MTSVLLPVVVMPFHGFQGPPRPLSPIPVTIPRYLSVLLVDNTHCKSKVSYPIAQHINRGQRLNPEARFSKILKSFCTPVESRNKSLNFMITELFYSHILNIDRGSLHTTSFRRMHLLVFEYTLSKNDFAGSKCFRGFRETGSRSLDPWYNTIAIWLPSLT